MLKAYIGGRFDSAEILMLVSGVLLVLGILFVL
jgi:hypothetical protein